MLLMIDNYDSFTYNLVQYFGELKQEVKVCRNDQISIAEISDMKPDYLVISPGPCTPDEAGISMQVIEEFKGVVPIFGVCLGHQCIAQVFGGEIIHAKRIMHGKTSLIRHTSKGVFSGLPDSFEATRYHSLVVNRQNMPDCLEITAWTEDEKGNMDEIMGIRHRKYPVEGVQFHPESILSECGHQLLKNFLSMKVEK
ncbi:MAG: aminodeoxychorismate/anthranilate synthase component II [Gammaproteobacteria bacterium]|nr:MAG: aminodeoxychorismate/anthranilate synthase component II [Gammaproteobacteria bacterium]